MRILLKYGRQSRVSSKDVQTCALSDTLDGLVKDKKKKLKSGFNLTAELQI